ncbi:response regulator [Bradyrhizobium sp. BR 10289]|uniref:response regulator transcription factor n=1 Tax=Bradyrhizobium sp. BR 10289 TaxID=2749993 RepID=UPI001C647311|nr:response regulator transcription factor [Bradyrhizobium sp. BR 10289]
MLDDEPGICQTISSVLSRAGFDVECSSDPLAFVGACLEKTPSCILIDLVLPGVTGLDVLRELRSRACQAPIVMISGQSDIATAVAAIKQGAFDFIEKPFRGSELASRISAAVHTRNNGTTRSIFHFPGCPPLTMREQDVLTELIGGQSTADIAARLELSPRTVESYRANIIRKIGARNPVEMVRLAIEALRKKP